MRVLTVRNPWGTAIIHGVEVAAAIDFKPVENRTRNIAGDYRGPVAIHIAQAWADGWALLWPRHSHGPTLDESLDAQRGHVIGVVDLTDVHESAECWRKPWKWETTDPVNGDLCSPWAMPDHHHLVLANPRPLPRPIPARGMLGLWRPDADLLAAITEQLANA